MEGMIEVPLDLPEVRLVSSEMGAKRELILKVESTKGQAICRLCGRETRKYHSRGRAVRLRHLPILGYRVFIEIEPKRYQCESCPDKPTTTEECSWYQSKSPHTRAFDESLMLALIGSTIFDVAKKSDVGEEAVEGALRRLVDEKVDWSEFKNIETLGIDEIALRKGHEDFITIISTILEDEQVIVLGVLEGRKKETLIEFFKEIPPKVRGTLKTVCIDMNRGFYAAAKNLFPAADIVVDRFHVAKAYRKGADSLRKKEMKRLRGELSKEDYKALKGVHWAFRRSQKNLNEAGKALLEQLFAYSPLLRLAYELREELTGIFERKFFRHQGKMALAAWKKKVEASPLECFNAFLVTLDNWLDEICNYFIGRQSSGFVEGLNNKLKVLKRRCYGIFNLSSFFRRITLDLEGYALFST